MIFLHFPKEKLFPILINRTAVLFFIMCLLTLFLYLAGTIQGFVDETQFLLLKCYTVFGIFLSVASIPGIAIDFYRFLKTKKSRYALRAAGYTFLAVFGTATVFAAMAILAIATGDVVY